MTAKWRFRAQRLFARRNVPTTDPPLIELGQRVMMFARRGHSIRCNRCGGNGPANGVVVLYGKALSDGGQRDLDNASVWCVGCAREAGRLDFLTPIELPVPLDSSPIQAL